MLDAFIIDELKRREEEERDDAGRPRLEIPDPGDEPPSDDKREDPGTDKDKDDDNGDEKKDRGVVVIDL